MKPKTRLRYAEIFEQHILPKFGASNAEEITQGEIGEWLTELSACGNIKSGKGLAGASIKQIVSAFRSLIAFGLSTEYISRNPFVGITVKGSQERKIETRTQFLDNLCDIDVLIIDDLGAENHYNNVSIEYLFDVINERTLNNKSTFISTNLTPESIQERYGDRLFSRLSDQQITLIMKLIGKDKRIVKL